MRIPPILLLLIVAFSLSAKPKLDDVVRQVQKQYDKTSSFEAEFVQKYHHKILNRDEESTGKMFFKKPGKLRWDYERPSQKSFIVDGKSLWIYQKADEMAYVDKCFKQDTLTASIAFLWGAGKISKQFAVSWFDSVLGEETDFHLTLMPKEKNGFFKKLILVVNPKSYRVVQSVVVDLEGNTNQFLFSKLSFNSKIAPAVFAFKPPKGIHVEPLPGSCH